MAAVPAAAGAGVMTGLPITGAGVAALPAVPVAAGIIVMLGMVGVDAT